MRLPSFSFFVNIRRFTYDSRLHLLNRLHGGQRAQVREACALDLLNRLHGGQPLLLGFIRVSYLLNRLHGGQLERIRDNIFIFQMITSWHPPIASFASPLFNYFIPKGFSEQLFLKPKGSYKKDEMLFPVSYCSHLYKPIPFLLCTSSSFPIVRNGPSAAAAPYWTATPCAQGNVAGCRP